MTTVSASLDFFRRRLRPWLELAGAEPALTEIMYDGDGCVSVDIAGELRRGELAALTDEDVVALGSNAAVYSDQVWSRERPFLSIIIPPDWRCSFVRPPVVERPVMSLRKLRRLPVPLQRYIDDGTMSATEAEHLRQLILARRTICVSGEVGSGKTTLLRTLLGLVPSNERIVTLEDPRELMLTAPDGVSPRPHYVALEATLGVMGLDALLRASLRLRPDRIIVGEVRGPEALELVRSLNTGHRGAMSTLHSNGARQALERLHTLTIEAQPGFHWASVERAIDVVIQIQGRGRERRISEIWENERAASLD